MSDAKSSGANPLQLVSSSRLQALRAKSEAAQSAASQATIDNPCGDKREDAETARLRRLIDQYLQRIIATMPSGKQHSLFKIRFGVTLEQLKALPPKEAAKRLKIKI